MKTEDTVEYNSLRWVKKELDLILMEAQASLSAYIEDTEDTARLREAVEHLHMVQGTLQMVELYGAAQLAEEMEKVSEALLEGKIKKVDDAYDVLMRSMLQLPDYLESLQSGSKDVPMVLLPLLNDLRASRNASLLSENVLFFPDVDSSADEQISGASQGDLQAAAKKLRPHYQIGLLGWFKGEKVAASLKRILAVLTELEKNSPSAASRRVWSIAAALVDGLSTNGIDSNVSIKTLLGQVDRSIKQLIDAGEENFVDNVPAELLKNLLYYVARIKSQSPRVLDIKATYRLEQLLPADNELEEARSGMGGLNSELLSTVSSGIREDLLEVKDALEIFVHSDVQDVARLKSLPDLLAKIADTLSMLGLGMPREQVIEQQKIVSKIIAGEHESSDEVIMDMAGVLLSVESQLNSFIANRSTSGADSSKDDRDGFAEMPDSEYQAVLSAVIKEGLQDFSDARQAILSYLDNNEDKSLLELVVTRLDQVNGAMFMLPVQKLKHQIDAVRNYIEKVMLNAGMSPDADTQNDIADVVTSVEYYLESILEGRPDIEHSMSAGDASAERLQEQTEQYGIDAASTEEIKDTAVDQGEAASDTARQETEQVEAPPAASAEQNAAQEEARYQIISDDADEEILEIFIEEALEVLDTLNEQVPLWSKDHGNEDAMVTVRRSFHTLKGSGRLIGAELIGEFAWNFESMLNRIIEKTRPLTQEVFDLLDEALAVLPELIEQLKGNKEPIPNIYELIDRAAVLAQLKKAEDKPAVTTAKKTVTTETPTAEVTESSPVQEDAVDGGISLELDELETLESSDTESADDIDIEITPDEIQLEDDFELNEDDGLVLQDEASVDTGAEAEIDLQMDASSDQSEAPAIDISEDEMMVDISDDELQLELEEPASEDVDFSFDETDESDAGEGFDIDLTDELEALQDASGNDVFSAEEDEAVAPSSQGDVAEEPAQEAAIDPILLDIFKKESRGHLEKIRELLELHYQGTEKMSANADLLRALHTLYGSAKTAEVEQIAELCGGLDRYAKLHKDRQDLSLSDTGIMLIDDVSQKVEEMLEQLTSNNKLLESDDALLQRINDIIDVTANENTKLSAAAAAAQSEPLDSVEPEQLTVDEIPAAPESVEAAVEDEMISHYEVDDELVDIFLEEAEELLDSCENSLQRWNADLNDKDSVQDLQRHLHTLKGGARMADLGPVGNLTHALESLVIAVNDGQVPFSREMSNVLHDSLDQLSDMLVRVKEREPMSTAAALISHIDALREGKETSTRPAPSLTDEEEEPEPGLSADTSDDQALDETYEIELSEDEALDEDFGFEIPDDSDEDTLQLIDEAAPGDDTGDSTETDDYAIEFDLDALSDDAAEDESVEFETEPSNNEALPVESLTPDQLQSAERAASDAQAENQVADEKSSLVLEKTSTKKTAAETSPKDAMANEQVRVRSDLLNELVNHAGEVSVYHARMGQQISNFSFNLSEMAQTVVRLRDQLRQLSIETEAQILSRYEKETDQYDQHFDPLEMDRFSTMQQISRSLQETVGDIESIKDILAEEVRDSETLLLQESRVSTELQEGLMRTRMVHFGGLASRLRRIVRQTARELGKEVELEIIGETAEVDRTVLDRIIAPLEHMLRNAVSHGIEQPAERVAAGKSDTGHLNITVDREGGDVVIIVKDDGKGIDATAIRAKAIEKGMIKAEDAVSDHDVLQYIMQPGFSTAEKVTQISGRGVGMDVVDSEIKQLGGVLEIDTVRGKGTTFTVRLPLTLAINHALLVNVGEEIYAVPLNSIEGVVRLSGPELQQFYDSGESHYQFAGSEYELKHLGRLLTGQQPDYSRSGQLFPLLLARAGDQRIALHVDELIGRREIVVKPVGQQINSVRGISGATILGDGRVVLILEVNALLLGGSIISLSEAEAAEADQQASSPVEEEREKIVMVVDDSITIRKVTERMLARHNMKVITAKDGVDAVSQLQEVMPDVMLLDIEMPRMDGYEVATHVRNDERLKDLPIIMITSRSGSKHRDKAMEIGVNKYLGKPYQEDDLMQNIYELIG
ncbi:MAG TPA: Hpt domain-containing protein [Gammaproteobacteria bacterium]